MILTEITGAILRIWEDGTDFPTPFSYSIFVVGHEGIAYLKGLQHGIKHGDRKNIAAALLKLGFHTAAWTRYSEDGKVRTVRVKLSENDEKNNDIDGRKSFLI